jgi:hypothetical protein
MLDMSIFDFAYGVEPHFLEVMNANDSLPRESRHGHGIHADRVVRGIRTLRAGVPASAKTWTLRIAAQPTSLKDPHFK